MANIKSRRALSDLFKKGTEIRFGVDPETGEPKGIIGPDAFLNDKGERIPPGDDVVMWIMPADPLQREMAMRDANARRSAAIVRAKRDKDSEEHLTILAFLADMGDESLIDYVIMGDTGMRRAQAEREVLADEEWKDITSYQDMMRKFDEMSDEEMAQNKDDWDAIMALDAKFVEQINARETELREAQRDVLRMTLASNRERVEQLALEKRSELTATQAFMQEYERQMRFYSVREFEDTSKLFFENADEMQRQPDVVKETIDDALMPYIADGSEAKN